MTFEELEQLETEYWIKNNTKKAKKRYFTEITEQAILAYNATEDELDRNKIYNKFIVIFDDCTFNIYFQFSLPPFVAPFGKLSGIAVIGIMFPLIA